MERLVDLDEMVLRCRTPRAADHIAEAVACYRSGAYRSCIVATWVAVVYDIIDKVRDLALHGEAKANLFVSDFSAIQDAHQRGDPGALQRSLVFERLILDRVRDDFEMLTPTEHLDLQRLREDRNRCAHPTMNQLDEAYRATAELARLHLRNAVMHVLQQPPSQGKAALESLKRDFSSSYLPQNEEEVLIFLKSGPLAKARDALIKDVVSFLVGKFFNSLKGPPTASSIILLLNGVRRLYQNPTEGEIKRHFRAEISKLSDQHLFVALVFVGNITDSWEMLTAAQQNRLKLYVRDGDAATIAPVLRYGDKIEALSTISESRIMKLDIPELAIVSSHVKGGNVFNRALILLENSKSWANSNTLIRDVISPALPPLDEKIVENLIRIGEANDEVKYATHYTRLMKYIKDQNIVTPEKYDELIERHSPTAGA